MSQLHAQLQAAHARRQAAENRIMTIHNDTMILDRQIDEARAALDHEWEVLQEEEMAVRREAADAIEEIRRLTEDIAMGGSRRNRNRTHRRRTKNI
jgi:predicted  nucleic acid-binding Zn-ribbon protein